MTSNHTRPYKGNKETQNLLLSKLSGVANLVFHQIVAVEFYEGGETHHVLSRKANNLLFIFDRSLKQESHTNNLGALISVTARVVKYACAIRDLQKVQNCDFQFDEETQIDNLIRSTKGLMWEAQISLLDLMLDSEEQVTKGGAL